MTRRREYIKEAAREHTHLNVFAIVKAVLESGAVYGGEEHAALQRISKICDNAIQRRLKAYDKYCALAEEAKK